MSKNKFTYISLFSSAGVGCYGFKMNGFECVATNELLRPRIDVQRANKKCKYDTGYIQGDITQQETKDKLFEEIDTWRKNEGLEQIDVVFATPPCQGMSTVNYKKNDHEQIRNSLVVEAIKIIKQIHPKIFVFENVRAFLTSICTDISGEDMLIKDSIFKNLSEDYNIYCKVINFKDFGVPSSRPRTLVIGTSKGISQLSPLNIFPTRQKEITLREAIGEFPRLQFGEKDSSDPLHFARPFPVHQIEWIQDLKEGQSAFDKPVEKQPYKIDENGQRVVLKGAYMGNKYRRLFWDKPGACVATRNDVLSSQDTIHPSDTRVLSIRELMRIMTIPDEFKWTEDDEALTPSNSDAYLSKNEMNIRRCIGEAVPTEIIRCIAHNISVELQNVKSVQKMVDEENDQVIYDKVVEKQADQIFNEINLCVTDKTKISIGIRNYSDFICYIKQIASMFVTIEKVEIIALGFSKKEKTNATVFLKRNAIGVHISISFVEGHFPDSLDFVIRERFERYKQTEQLSLFD